MLFSEVYSVYYTAVAKLIDKAIDGELSAKNTNEIINSVAFSESFIYIMDNIKSENWSVITKDFKTPIKNKPNMPLTTLQKRFIKTISLDPRFKLFCDELPSGLEDVDPLYAESDFHYFDKLKDGDPYNGENYIKNFKKILRGLKENKRLRIIYRGGKGVLQNGIFTPRKLEYSEKDDKFRLLCMGGYSLVTINLARVKNVEIMGVFDEGQIKPFKRNTATLTMQITNDRNALERIMHHFAHFKKETKRIDKKTFEMNLTYYTDDETEILIRVLSFGPMIKVLSPVHFIDLIKERLVNQKSCEL